ncbi:MAG: CRISPR-associated protein Csx3 [Candidatus Peregrinibacteria bacterium]
MSIEMTLGDLLEERNLTIQDLAEKTKLSVAEIIRLTSGAGENEQEKLQTIADALHVSLHTLLRSTDQKEVAKPDREVIIVCGPPHSGKSVFFSALKHHLPRRNTRLFRACPDGEGTWSQKSDEGVAQIVRHKGNFSREFMEFALSGIENISAKRTLVDVGGIRSEENGDIFRRGTHAVVLCRTDKPEEKAAWEAFAKEHGLIVMASLDSSLEGEQSACIDEHGTIRGKVVGLERGQDVRSEALVLLAQRILDETQEEQDAELVTEIDGMRLVSLDKLADDLKVPSQGKTIKRPDKGYDVDIDLPWWTGAKIREGVESIQTLNPEAPVCLDGGHPAALYAAVTAALPAKEVWYTDETNFRGGRGKVENPEVSDSPSATLDWKAEERDEYTLVEVGWKKGVQWTMANFTQYLSELNIPAVNPQKGVVISGKMAYLIFGSLTRAYQNLAKWVGIFTPQQKEDANMQWPAMVVFSTDEQHQVGDYIDCPAIGTAAPKKTEIKEADKLRNPHQHKLKAIAKEYMERMRQKLPDGAIIDLGGSLRSNTALKGHNDIDLRVLLPTGADDEAGVRAASSAIAEIVPFQKVRPVDSPPHQKFAVMHQLNFHRDDIEGEVEIEVSIRPAEGYVGYARFQETLPQDVLDRYVLLKQQAVASKPAYKKVKALFYAMTRWLYAKGYWNAEGQVVGNPRDMEEALRTFWGSSLEEVMSKEEETA